MYVVTNLYQFSALFFHGVGVNAPSLLVVSAPPPPSSLRDLFCGPDQLTGEARGWSRILLVGQSAGQEKPGAGAFHNKSTP